MGKMLQGLGFPICNMGVMALTLTSVVKRVGTCCWEELNTS